MPHAGDAVVVLCDGAVDAAVLDAHGAELIHLEDAPGIRRALLPVEHRAVILELDGQRRHQHDRRGDHKADGRDNDVHQALEHALLKRQLAGAGADHGLVVKEQALAAEGHDVLGLDAVIDDLPVLIAVGDDPGPLYRLQIIQEHRVAPVDERGDVLLIVIGDALNAVLLFEAADLFHQIRGVFTAVGDNQAVLRRVDAEIQAVSGIGRDDDDGHLQHIDQQQPTRILIDEVAEVDDRDVHDAEHQVRHQIREQQRQRERKNDGLALAHADIVAAVHPRHEQVDDSEGNRRHSRRPAQPQEEEILLAHQQKEHSAAEDKYQQPHQKGYGIFK